MFRSATFARGTLFRSARGGILVSESSYSRVILAMLVVFSLSLGGCLTLNPSVSADTSNSTVFKSVSATEPWSGPGVRVNATLRSSNDAGNVTTLTVIEENGRTYQTISVGSGQTTVILSLPAHQNATIVASNSVNSTTIEKLNVTTGGDKIV